MAAVSRSTQGSNVDSRGLLGKMCFNGFYKCRCLLNLWFTLKIDTYIFIWNNFKIPSLIPNLP